jgi:serine protease DegQ
MHRLWLVFSQAVTVAVAALFVVATFHPEWLVRESAPAAISTTTVVHQAPPLRATDGGGAHRADSYSDAVERAMPSVVNVFTSKESRGARSPLFDDPIFRRFFGDQLPDDTQRAASLGSGVIVTQNGYILTNHHVVDAASEIEVAFPDGRKLLARVVGNDPDTDLAVLKVDAGGLRAITFAAGDSLRVGDVVLAMGNPFGVGQAVTSGIVSALGRSGLHINTFENFIQTDAAINPGNSGGALVDARGRLVGINTAIYSRSGGSMGIGFAIPVSTAKQVLDQIVASGTVTRGWIGVEIQEITPALAESFPSGGARGAMIAGVLNGGPADRAGVRPGDVLLSVDGKQIANPAAMLHTIAALTPGKPAQLNLQRRGKSFETEVIVGRRPRPKPRAE